MGFSPFGKETGLDGLPRGSPHADSNVMAPKSHENADLLQGKAGLLLPLAIMQLHRPALPGKMVVVLSVTAFRSISGTQVGPTLDERFQGPMPPSPDAVKIASAAS